MTSNGNTNVTELINKTCQRNYLVPKIETTSQQGKELAEQTKKNAARTAREKSREKKLQHEEYIKLKKTGLWRCRCGGYGETCHCNIDSSYTSEFCLDATKILAEKYGFDFKEAFDMLSKL